MDKDRISRISSVVDGNYLLLAGDYAYDDWEKDFVINKVKGMAVIDRYDVADKAENKRVELHCHTNMSTKDAVSHAGDIINRAFKWGHKAVAITDHGVVQAYPAAAEAVSKIRKNGGDFKVIYGVEAYFMDDLVESVDGNKNSSLDDTFICFDIETTGLSAKTENGSAETSIVTARNNANNFFFTLLYPSFFLFIIGSRVYFILLYNFPIKM